MDKAKEIELLRKRNASLSNDLEDAKNKYDELKYLNSESTKKAQELILELEAIRDDWIATMEDLHKKQEECNQLLAVLREMKFIMEEPKETSEPERATLLSRLMGKIREI